MNELQFKKLKIGDRILTYNGACTTVTDIDRMAGKLTCGNGQWRDYHRVRMAVETELLVEHKRVQDYVPPDTVILSRALLLKLGFSKVCILRAIENCGPDGFLGTLQDLFVRTEFISIEYVRNLVPVMIREGLIQRKVVKRGLFRLTINK